MLEVLAFGLSVLFIWFVLSRTKLLKTEQKKLNDEEEIVYTRLEKLAYTKAVHEVYLQAYIFAESGGKVSKWLVHAHAKWAGKLARLKCKSPDSLLGHERDSNASI